MCRRCSGHPRLRPHLVLAGDTGSPLASIRWILSARVALNALQKRLKIPSPDGQTPSRQYNPISTLQGNRAFFQVSPRWNFRYGSPCRSIPTASISGALEEADDRENYGEERWRAIGSVHGRVLVVAYTEVGEAIRLISARKADDDERFRHYRENYG
ncbi:hypothetical protein CMK11_00600 [Candidatus Poribacteria bacterium]|nr:hypothetical protein [Candidatus Poribacteria bacterium]